VQLGNLNFAQKRFSEAESSYRLGLGRDPRSNDSLRGLMNTYVAMKQTDAAVAAAKVQIAKVQDSSIFYDLLGTTLFQQKKDLNGAKEALEKSAQLDRNNTDALLKLGQVEEAIGQTEDAIRTYQRGANDNPHEASFHIFLGQIFQARQNWTNAEHAYEKALAIRQDDPVAACNLAYVTVKMGGDLDVALSLAQTARRKMPQSPDAADTLGWIYYQKGVYRPAIESLQAALALMQQSNSADNPRFHYHLGMAYAKIGDATHARQQFQKLVKMDPASAEAAEATKQLSHIKS
jgi:tetratricopeptide (TPR) repeat protein